MKTVEMRIADSDPWEAPGDAHSMREPPEWWKESQYEWCLEWAFSLERKGWKTRIVDVA